MRRASGAQIIAALQAYDDALHGKSGTLADRVVAMAAAIEAASEEEPEPERSRLSVFGPRHTWNPRA